jgi:rhodopsin domain-containing protein
VSINTYIVSLGFGTHIWTISKENLKIINLNTIMVATFGILATTTSKTSFALTLYRISPSAWMKYFLIFVIISVNISMNLVWIFGLAKCQPLQKVFDGDVEGTCWDRRKLLKFQLFAACECLEVLGLGRC